MGKLAGKYALVTGASKGVGKGIALELAKAGAEHIFVNYNSDREGTEQTQKEIQDLGSQATILQANVGNSQDVDRMFAAVDRVDILVNNAGVQTWKPLLDLTEAEWDRVIDTNLKGAFLCTQRAARKMKDAATGGRIINIGSGCNKVAFPSLVDYTASKGGIEMFTKVSACELGKYGIAVNCVAPGAVEIERTKHEAGDYAGTWSKVAPLGRVGTPQDIGKAVVFFAGNDSDFVTGQTLWVDGGVFSKPYWPYE
ncbi:MAG: 3-oxoacyl-ACP reductase FabG [Acidobacteria bacterium]|nr:3-oxoacyl-ACP reductase FabG [Acidobacteriota bacterium]